MFRQRPDSRQPGQVPRDVTGRPCSPLFRRLLHCGRGGCAEVFSKGPSMPHGSPSVVVRDTSTKLRMHHWLLAKSIIIRGRLATSTPGTAKSIPISSSVTITTVWVYLISASIRACQLAIAARSYLGFDFPIRLPLATILRRSNIDVEVSPRTKPASPWVPWETGTICSF